MHVLTIGSDRKLFERGSAVHLRIKKQAELFQELHIIVFSLRSNICAALHEGNLHIYPTQSFSKFLYVFDAARIARRIPADVITTQDPFESGLAGVLGRKGRPLQVQLHTDPFSPFFIQASFLNRVRRALAAFVLPRAQGMRVTTEALRQRIQKRYNLMVPITVLPIFVNVARFFALQKKKHPRFNIALLWVGRFEAEKNPMLAIRVLAQARAAGCDVGLTMLGNGSLLPKLIRLADELQMGAWVEFPGWQDPAAHLSVSDLLLCTSEYEGYGMAIVEALAARVPVLSTDVGIAREAGAHIVEKERFGKKLIELLRAPLPSGALRLPIMVEAEYLRAYRDSLAQLCT